MHYNKYTKYKNKNLQIGGTVYAIYGKLCNPDNRKLFLDYVMSCPQIKTMNETIFYYASLLINGVEFNCAILLKQSQKFDMFFLDITYDLNKKELTNNNIFDNSYIILNFSDSDKISTRFNFPVMRGKNKLETILDILDIIYFHFCYDKIELRDVAEFSCLIPDHPIIEYNAIIYRIFYTDKPINEISIYTRAEYNYTSICNTEDLDFLRNYNVSDFRDFLINIRFHNRDINNVRINLIHKLKSYIGYNLHHFFKNSDDAKIDTPENCYKNHIYLKLLESIKRGNFKHPFGETLKKFCACVSNLAKMYRE